MILLLGASAAAVPTYAEQAERRVGAMGTDLTVVVEASHRAEALEAGEAAIQAIRRAESRLSTWDPGSELSRVNAAPAGVEVPVSPLLARDLADARRCAVDTGDAFTPGMGGLVEAWGLRTGGRRPTDEAIASLLPAIGARNLLVTPDGVTRLHERFMVEEGAFGKGAGLDDAVVALAATSAQSAVLDLGGQVAVWGGASVSIEISDPRRRERVVLRLDIASGSVATTGNSERGIVVGGERLGHVLDPATGRPSRDFGSVTVWAERAALADCLSTGLYVMGPERALQWAAGHPEVAVVVLETTERGLRARATRNLRERLKAVSADVDVQFADDRPPATAPE